ncbi:DUF3068 domain-containing protein [Skermania piniformis]|uniref:DUF3068 domain-containing protein n=1 Tax=Skermania pinensis TaxID=39122 RepID=A0ABX8SB29_9ACTN|nr:DUF3068 domain-containing protein [Skermania piniformis]QXQ13775.1 DUF3068 domain-containing protein [Skermania piniformis]
MAEGPGSGKRLACLLVGLGALLLTAALLIPTYAIGKIAKTPLDLEITTIATTAPDKGAQVLDARSLTTPTGKAQVNANVPLVSQRFLTVEEPADADRVTLQAGQTLRRTDKQGDTGLLTATVDRVTIDRTTGEPLDDPIGSIQVQADQPAEEVPHTGLQYRFPIGTEKKSYPFFDINARQSADMSFVDETEISGLKVYHFKQTIPPVDLSKVVNSPANKLSLPADKWGVPGGADPVTMTRWYTDEREVWVEPKTGTIVRGQEQVYQYYARAADKPEVTVLQAALAFDENTVESQAATAKQYVDEIALYGRFLPISFGIVGLLALLAGIFLGIRGGSGGRGRRSPAVATDPPDTGAHAMPDPADPPAPGYRTEATGRSEIDAPTEVIYPRFDEYPRDR